MNETHGKKVHLLVLKMRLRDLFYQIWLSPAKFRLESNLEANIFLDEEL